MLRLSRASATKQSSSRSEKVGATARSSRSPQVAYRHDLQEQRGTQSKLRNTLDPRKAQNVHTVTLFEGFRQATSTQKGKSLTFLLPFYFSHHIPLLICRSPSTVKARLCCCDGSARELHWHCDNRVVCWGTMFFFSLQFPGARSSTLGCVLLLLCARHS